MASRHYMKMATLATACLLLATNGADDLSSCCRSNSQSAMERTVGANSARSAIPQTVQRQAREPKPRQFLPSGARW